MQDKNSKIAGFPKKQVLDALEDNLWQLWSNFGRMQGSKLYDEDGAIWFDTPIPTLPYHGVLKFTGDQNVEGRVKVLVNHFTEQRVPFIWVVHPSAPTGLVEHLEAQGMREAEILTGMVADLNEVPEPEPVPDGFVTRKATTQDEISQVLEMVAWRWDVPEDAREYIMAFNEQFQLGTQDAVVRVWVAFQGSELVSKVVLRSGEDAAGLYGVATRPEARGNGLATRLTLESLRKAAREDGYQMAVLHSSPMAESLYEKLGFRVVEPFRIYASTEMHL